MDIRQVCHDIWTTIRGICISVKRQIFKDWRNER
jgi:hypothetical protein